MQTNANQTTQATPPLASSGLPPRIDSNQLLRGHRTIEIAHGQNSYTLRVTKDNKLILTK